MILSKIKVYALASLGLLVTGLLIAVKILSGRNSRLRREVETAEAKVHHAKVVAQERVKSEVERHDNVTQAKLEIDEFGHTKELSEKDDDW